MGGQPAELAFNGFGDPALPPTWGDHHDNIIHDQCWGKRRKPSGRLWATISAAVIACNQLLHFFYMYGTDPG